jgi:hypothetical protein
MYSIKNPKVIAVSQRRDDAQSLEDGQRVTVSLALCAGLLDGATARPASTRDLFYGLSCQY